MIIDLLSALVKYLQQVTHFLRYLLKSFPLRKFIDSPNFPTLTSSQTTKSVPFLLHFITHLNADVIPTIINVIDCVVIVLARQINFYYCG